MDLHTAILVVVTIINVIVTYINVRGIIASRRNTRRYLAALDQQKRRPAIGSEEWAREIWEREGNLHAN